MQTQYLLLPGLLLCGLLLSAQPQFPVFHQVMGADHLLIEAEDLQFLDPPALPTQRSWTTQALAPANVDTVLAVIPGTSYGINPSKTVAMGAAKAQYYLQFDSPGIYFLYFRYTTKGPVTAGSSTILVPSVVPDQLPTKLAVLNTAGSNLRWAQGKQNGNGRPISITISDVDQLYVLPFIPSDPDLLLDKIVLHKVDGITMIDFSMLAPTPLVKPTAPSNILKYSLPIPDLCFFKALEFWI